MEPAPFRSLVQQHLLPLFSGAELVPGTIPSPPQRPAVAKRSRRPMPGGGSRGVVGSWLAWRLLRTVLLSFPRALARSRATDLRLFRTQDHGREWLPGGTGKGSDRG